MSISDGICGNIEDMVVREVHVAATEEPQKASGMTSCWFSAQKSKCVEGGIVFEADQRENTL